MPGKGQIYKKPMKKGEKKMPAFMMKKMEEKAAKGKGKKPMKKGK